jgi:predicted nuclease of predicted toxin-antitoxin system
VKRLLIDENLPFSLGARLGVDYIHASQIAEQASDTLLWQKARENDWIVLTRDTDFFDRLLRHGVPPRVIWIRLGNVRKSDLLRFIEERWPAIQQLIQSHDLIEVYADRLEALCFPNESTDFT